MSRTISGRRPHLQLHGKIQFAFQPRLDDELAVICNRAGNPAAMRFQKFRLEQTDRVAAREAMGFLADNFVMPALTDGLMAASASAGEFAAAPISFSEQSQSNGCESDDYCLSKLRRTPHLRENCAMPGLKLPPASRFSPVRLAKTGSNISTLSAPKPTVEPPQLAFGEPGATIQLHKFRQRKTGPFDSAQKFHRRLLVHQNDVVLPAKKLRQIFQIMSKVRLMPRGIERFARRCGLRRTD